MSPQNIIATKRHRKAFYDSSENKNETTQFDEIK